MRPRTFRKPVAILQIEGLGKLSQDFPGGLGSSQCPALALPSSGVVSACRLAGHVTRHTLPAAQAQNIEGTRTYVQFWEVRLGLD